MAKGGFWRGLTAKAGAIILLVGGAASAGAQDLAPLEGPWRVLATSDSATLYYSDDQLGGGSYQAAPGSTRLIHHRARAGGRTVFRGRADGAILAVWEREFDCIAGTGRMSRIVSVRADGTIAAANVMPDPWARPARNSPEARLATLACTRSAPNYLPPQAPVDAADIPAGDEAGWGWGRSATPELRALNVELNRRCRAMGGSANFIPDSLFGVDADLDGDGDDTIMYEGFVFCPRSEEDEDPRPVCGDGPCRQFLFVDDERGYHRAWVGTDPAISAVLGLAARPESGNDDALRPVRWDGRGFVPTNGRQGNDGPRVQIEPDGIAGARPFIFPIRINCLNEYCTWLRTPGAQPVPGVAEGRLFRLPLRIGLSSEYSTDYADVFDSQVSPDWLGLAGEAYVFCSRSHPAVLKPSAAGGYRYRIVDLPGAVGRDDGSARLYVAVCHPGVRAGDAAAVRRLGYAPVPAGRGEGVVRVPSEIAALERR